MRCLHCGKGVPLLRRLKGEAFCSPAHRQQYCREEEQMALARLVEAKLGPGSATGALNVLELSETLADVMAPGWFAVPGTPATDCAPLAKAGRMALPEMAAPAHACRFPERTAIGQAVELSPEPGHLIPQLSTAESLMPLRGVLSAAGNVGIPEAHFPLGTLAALGQSARAMKAAGREACPTPVPQGSAPSLGALASRLAVGRSPGVPLAHPAPGIAGSMDAAVEVAHRFVGIEAESSPDAAIPLIPRAGMRLRRGEVAPLPEIRLEEPELAGIGRLILAVAAPLRFRTVEAEWFRMEVQWAEPAFAAACQTTVPQMGHMRGAARPCEDAVTVCAAGWAGMAEPSPLAALPPKLDQGSPLWRQPPVPGFPAGTPARLVVESFPGDARPTPIEPAKEFYGSSALAPNGLKAAVHSEAEVGIRLLPLRSGDILPQHGRTSPKSDLRNESVTGRPVYPLWRSRPARAAARKAHCGRATMPLGPCLRRISDAWHHLPPVPKWAGLVMVCLLAAWLVLPRDAMRLPASQPGRDGTQHASVTGPWERLQQSIAGRAAISLTDDFRHGLADWEGEGRWAENWSYDPAGFVRVGPLARYTPTRNLTDYHMEFLGQIEQKAIAWAVRAGSFDNYYAIKLTVAKPGPLPTVVIQRYPVVNGKPEPVVQRPLPLTLHNDTLYRVRVDVDREDFVLSVQGQVVDHWSEPRLRTGGIGFFAAKGERSRLRWVGVWHQYDTLGRLCALVAPYQFTSQQRSVNP